MQKKNIVKIIQGKKWIHIRFIVLLCIAFLFQHLSFANEQNIEAFSNLHYRASQNKYFEKGNAQDHSPQLHLYVEAESEDEDDVHNEHNEVKSLISTNHHFIAALYSGAINTLYLRLASTNQHKVDLPFFMLYDCWKSHLA